MLKNEVLLNVTQYKQFLRNSRNCKKKKKKCCNRVQTVY